MKQIIIDDQTAGKKLFRFLQQRILTEMKNCDIFRVIRQGKVKINGKKVKGKKITFKFNGKTYKVKTNKKGIAQKTLNKKH